MTGSSRSCAVNCNPLATVRTLAVSLARERKRPRGAARAMFSRMDRSGIRPSRCRSSGTSTSPALTASLTVATESCRPSSRDSATKTPGASERFEQLCTPRAQQAIDAQNLAPIQTEAYVYQRCLCPFVLSRWGETKVLHSERPLLLGLDRRIHYLRRLTASGHSFDNPATVNLFARCLANHSAATQYGEVFSQLQQFM